MNGLVGARVTVRSGPFATFPGTVTAQREDGQLVVAVEMFGRKTDVTIGADGVTPEDARLLDDADIARLVTGVLEKRAWTRQVVRWASRAVERAWTDAELAANDDVFVEADHAEVVAMVAAVREDPGTFALWSDERTRQDRAATNFTDEDRAMFGDAFIDRVLDGIHLRDRALRVRQLAADPTPIARDAALEAQIDRDPESAEAYAVYGDWLQARDDPRGQLVALQLAGQPFEGFLARHRGYLVGALDLDDPAAEVTWGTGFFRSARVKVREPAVIAAVLACPAARFLRELAVTCTTDLDDQTAILDALTAGVTPALRRLALVTDHEEHMLAWTTTGALDRLWPRVAALHALRIEAGDVHLGAIELPELRELAIETCHLTDDNVDALAAARWPHLRHLTLWFGSRDRGGEPWATSALPVARRLAMPALRELGIVNTEESDALCESLARDLPMWDRLEVLDLSRGTMTDAGACALAGSLPRGLRRLDVSENYLTDVNVFERPGLEVIAAGQRFGEIDSDPHRYCAVIE